MPSIQSGRRHNYIEADLSNWSLPEDNDADPTTTYSRTVVQGMSVLCGLMLGCLMPSIRWKDKKRSTSLWLMTIRRSCFSSDSSTPALRPIITQPSRPISSDTCKFKDEMDYDPNMSYFWVRSCNLGDILKHGSGFITTNVSRWCPNFSVTVVSLVVRKK